MKSNTNGQWMGGSQMELGLTGAARCPRVVQRERRVHRARWWFDHMRQVVERAKDWEPAPRFEPEQTWLPVADHRPPTAS